MLLETSITDVTYLIYRNTRVLDGICFLFSALFNMYAFELSGISFRRFLNNFFQEKTYIKIMYSCFIVLIFYPTLTYKFLFTEFLHRMTTLPIDLSIKLPTKSYLATLVPRRMHQNFFVGLTLRSISNISFTKLLSLIADTMI